MLPSDRYIGSLTNDKESLPCNMFLHLLANSFLRLFRDQTANRWMLERMERIGKLQNSPASTRIRAVTQSYNLFAMEAT
jgi:hypothetical protein